jgi:N-acetyl-anhydromuramyl-L-alanine amidase AmpD
MKYPQAHWTPAHANNFSTAKNTPKFIVAHVICGSWTGCRSWFQNPAAQVSAHFSISKQGEVNQHVDTDQTAYAQMAWNQEAISIEHEGYPGDHLTLKQIAALDALLTWIHANYNIPLKWVDSGSAKDGGVLGHGVLGVAGGNHISCPGAQIISDVKHLLARKQGIKEAAAKPQVSNKNRPVLRLHSRGKDVKDLQAALHIQVDGEFGKQTEAAVKHFQETHRIAVDGIVGPITWSFLKIASDS